MNSGQLTIDNEMSGGMKYRYRNEDEMKDSGIEWLGNVPVQWQCLRLRNLGNISTSSVDKKIDEQEKIVKLVNYVDIYNSKTKEIYNDDNYMRVSAKEKQIETCNLLMGDVLFTPSSETINDIGYSAVVMEDLENTLYSYHILRLRFEREVYLNFKKYMFWSNSFLNYLSSRATGTTRKTLSLTDFKDNTVIIPTMAEQKKIAKFLDEKTAQFDSIISKKEALIQKLEEAKKSLISEVVTGKVKVVKTDDGYELVERKKEEMKDSGVEWLGIVPSEWNIYRSKNLWKKEKREVKEEYGVVTAFRDGEVTLRENRRTEGFTFSIKEIGYQGVLKGDLVISAMDAFAGAMGISDSEGKCSPVYSVCSPLKELEPQYYNFLLKEMSQKGYILSLAKGIRERSTDFRYSEFANTFLLYPNLEEQRIIANYLLDKVSNINRFKIKINNQIEKLKEAKQSLISEAVTGKIEILD